MNDKKAESKAAFDRQAAGYDTGMQGQHARALYPVLLAKLAQIPFGTLLDLGCGTGELLRLLLQADPGREVCGIDLSEKMLAVARAKLPEEVPLLQADSEAIPFPDGTFDVVCCNDSFHHYPAPQTVLREVWRVLKPGGTFLLGDCWQPWPGRVLMNWYMRHSREGDVKIYAKAEMCAMLAQRFRDVSWQRVGGTACVAAARK